jgi:hypothetical protein
MGLKSKYFLWGQKKDKKGQMNKSFYFKKTVSKREKLDWFGLFRRPNGNPEGGEKGSEHLFHFSMVPFSVKDLIYQIKVRHSRMLIFLVFRYVTMGEGVWKDIQISVMSFF